MRSAVFHPPMNCWQVVVGLLVVWLFSATVMAQEITNFKFTGYEASVSTNVQSDTSNTVTPIANSTEVIKTDQRQTDVRLETSLMTHSYVYHPKFLSLDIGFGAISATNTLETNDIYLKTHEPLYNYSLHGSVLPEKPMHGTFFFDRLNSSPTVGSGESFRQLNDKYGFTTTVMTPLLPATVLVDVTREANKGEGSQRSLDEKIDRVGISARKEISKYGSTELSFRSVKQDSTNGVNNLPVQSSSQDSRLVSIDTRLKLGNTAQHDLSNLIEYSTQKYGFTQGVASELKDARFGLNYRGYHSTILNSFANLQSNRTTQDLYFNNANALSGGAIWTIAKDFDVTGGAHTGNAQATQSSNRSMGVDASTRYTRPLAIGTGAVNYSVRYEKFDQTATNPFSPAFKERVTITKNSDSRLAFRNVNLSSIKVWNSNCTVVDVLTGDRYCVLGQDYEIVQLGADTSLRMSFGATSFPDVTAEVLVDYEYENGGTYGSAQVDQSLSFTWTLSPQFNVFARYSDSSPKVTSGDPSIPLSQVKSLWYGLRSTVPLSVRYDLVFTGNLDQENRREDNQSVLQVSNSSYVRTSGDFYIRGELPMDFSNNYSAGMRRVRLVADDPKQSVDQTSYELAFGWRTGTGLNLVASGLVERDSDYLTERDRKSLSLRALWRYRRFYASADLVRTREKQDLYSRDRTVARLTLRRDL